MMVIPRALSPKIVFLVGPTAVGKSAVAGALARKLNAEIISCDSMQVYRGMDIVTSKPSRQERGRIAHHCIDICQPTHMFDVNRYRRMALCCLKGILKRGKTALFVGGTGLYLSILLDGLFTIKGSDQKYRDSLYVLSQKRGSKFLHAKLSKIDPKAAAKIHPHDARRIIRALEVYKITGKRISELQANRSGLWGKYPTRIFCLDMKREDLYERIHKRVDSMFRKGLVKEVKKLLALPLSKTALLAIGIREVQAYCNGEYDLAVAKEIMKRNTRWYAKRQLTWFRKDTRITWIEITDRQTPSKIAEAIMKELH